MQPECFEILPVKGIMEVDPSLDDVETNSFIRLGPSLGLLVLVAHTADDFMVYDWRELLLSMAKNDELK